MRGTTDVPHPPPARARGPMRALAGVALAGLAVALPAACSLEEAECGGGEYPVLNVGSTGSACVPDDEEPPKGFVRYPEGKVPRHVGDKWDEYWNTHTIDEHGHIVKAPDAG